MTRSALVLLLVLAPALSAEVPEGFISIFNHQNIAGWHISVTNHHGDTSEWRVRDRALTVAQNQPGNGGILLTDEKYADFEVYVEIQPDFGCDGGLFLRSNGNGQAYQVMLDYLEGGNIGGVYGERLEGVVAQRSEGWEQVWKKKDWNALRVRIEGEAPRIQVWLNGMQITDFRDTANHAAGAARDGMIAVQVHGGSRCEPGKFHRYREIAVRRLD